MDTTSSTSAITQRHRRPFTRSLLLVMLVLGVVVARYATPVLAAHVVPPVVPTAIAVPSGNTAYLVGHATGTQNYTCTAAGAWSPAVPAATLVDDTGKQIATHYAGPTWQANDGSKVVGTKVAGVPVSSTAIPWLLIKAASTARGSGGGDQLFTTTYVQRVKTTGGLAPAGSCVAGTTAHIPYTADYYFSHVATVAAPPVTLPNTGTDHGWQIVQLALGGLSLLGSGWLLRRRGQQQRQATSG